MSHDRSSDHMPERPRSEPEIIPPGDDAAFRGRERIWTRFDDGASIHRVYIARPGWPSILLGLFILSAIIALGFVIVAGVLLLWLPIAVAGILLALFYGPIRYRWRRLQDWLGGRQ